MIPFDTFALIVTARAGQAAGGPQAWHWILFIVVVGGVTAWALPAILKWQQRRTRQTIHLALSNEGNTRSRYALLATDPTGALTFHFSIDGKSLPAQVTAVPAPARPATTHATSPRTAPTEAGGINVQKTLSGAAQTGGVVAGLLGTLGRLLPGSAGRSLAGIGHDVRQGQQMATQAKQASQYAGKLQPQPGSSQPIAGKRQPGSEIPSTQNRAGTNVIEIWSQTPLVEPGQVMHIALQIQSTKPYQTQQCPYILKSRSLEYKEAPVLMEEDIVLIEALNPFDRFAPFLMFAAGIMVAFILFLSLW